MMHPEYDVEKSRFESTMTYLNSYFLKIRGERDLINKKIETALKHYNSDNIDQFTELALNTTKQEFIEQKVRDMGRWLKKPYFARVDFTPDTEAAAKIYIGKFTLFDDSGLEILITDWRAPVSTLYYEGRVGRAGYDCPDGVINGEITLKRQYLMEDGKLLDIMDIDITTNDEFLQAALGSSKDMRLKDIVTTIQAEQNRIIRTDMFSPLIVQGAAGSGKTTIALHRISYLLYAHEDRVKPRNMMIMAPNKFFLSYISDVLPDLGVDNVAQTTFEEFAQGFIGKRVKISPAIRMLADAIENNTRDTDAMRVAALKASLKYKKLIERYYEYYANIFIPDVDFDIEGYVVISKERVREYILKDYSYLPLKKRVAELKKNLDSALKREKDKLLNFIDLKYEAKRNDVKREMEDCPERRKIITQILDERDKKLGEIRKIISNRIKEYINGFSLVPADRMYMALIGNQKLFSALAKGIFSSMECEAIRGATLSYIEKGYIELDDVAPLMYLKYKLYGAEERMEYKHVVIDEAQDYSIFQFSVLREVLGINSFSVMGDISQGIYSYRGVKNWGDICEKIFDSPQYMTLEQSYRTTIEIMDAANKVIDHLYAFGCMEDIKKARPVIRHGKDVVIAEKQNLSDVALAIDEDIDNCKKQGHRSIAVICKTKKECEALAKLMKTKVHTISMDDKDYKGGVLLASSYLVKGLEFDAVIIANASAENYITDELDIKLLYVAMTRALHQLNLYYCGTISPLLAEVSKESH